MKNLIFALFAAGALFGAGAPRTFTGVITDSMCGGNHAAMRIAPDAKCVRECVKAHGSKYVLYDGRNVYRLSDQQTPEQFAGQKVKLTGTFFPQTGIIQVGKIEPLR